MFDWILKINHSFDLKISVDVRIRIKKNDHFENEIIPIKGYILFSVYQISER